MDTLKWVLVLSPPSIKCNLLTNFPLTKSCEAPCPTLGTCCIIMVIAISIWMVLAELLMHVASLLCEICANLPLPVRAVFPYNSVWPRPIHQLHGVFQVVELPGEDLPTLTACKNNPGVWRYNYLIIPCVSGKVFTLKEIEPLKVLSHDTFLEPQNVRNGSSS